MYVHADTCLVWSREEKKNKFARKRKGIPSRVDAVFDGDGWGEEGKSLIAKLSTGRRRQVLLAPQTTLNLGS